MSFHWITLEDTLYIHQSQIESFGGLNGVRDMNSLQSSLARPINKYSFENASLEECAAALAYGIARNHSFLDGNKRTAFVSALTFLNFNDFDLNASNDEVIEMFLALAAGKVTESELAGWFRKYIIRLDLSKIE